MTRRTLYMPALIAVAVLMACAAALLALSEKAEATFPGKNGRIAYSSFGLGTDGGIYTINPGGGGRTKVTDPRVSGDAEPSYSPNGKRIAYSDYDGNDYEIYTINADGGGKKKVTNTNTNDFGPAYSPDGKKIAYAGYSDSGVAIYTINVGGGGKYKVTEGRDPAYSPDGKRIAYASYEGPDTEIYTIRVDGGGKAKVTNNVKDEEAPSYSPNGERIAYEGFKGLGSDDDEDYDHEIYTINVGGGGKTQVTDTAGFASDPSWGSRP